MDTQPDDLTPDSEWEKNEAEIVNTDNSGEEGQEALPQDPIWKATTDA